MEKRYQVFVSSTYQDLQDERQEVMQALLELDCIPSGMELFPAANEDQWTLIKKVIDECDYYIVIIAGRYGSVTSSGMSYTEQEYRYALEIGKPVLSFVHKDPEKLPLKRSEKTDKGKERLEEFKKLVQQKMVKYWEGPADLGSVVSRSLVQLRKTHPAVGWVRADLAPDEGAAQQILKLRKQAEDLEQKLVVARKQAPPGTEQLAQGEDEFEIKYTFRAGSLGRESYQRLVKLSWNRIFHNLSPLMINEVQESSLIKAINDIIRNAEISKLQVNPKLKDQFLDYFQIDDNDFQTIKVQLRALGLIEKSVRQRSVKDTRTYWTLTEYGDEIMNQLRAIRRDH